MTTTQTVKDAPYLFLILWKAWRAIEQVDRRSIQGLGIGCFSDFVVMEALLHKGALPVSELGKKAGLTSGSITTAVQRLEKQGWIGRESSPSDGRSIHIHLSEAGRDIISKAFAEHARQLDQVFAPLVKGEREEFVRLLKKVGRTAEAISL
ncbi:MAG TPA: MarR family transcriptional regulator [Oceanipulchritudo sp.]|nr:MarR family transcriptional regulator [Oceanipulchritudo sp.]